MVKNKIEYNLTLFSIKWLKKIVINQPNKYDTIFMENGILP